MIKNGRKLEKKTVEIKYRIRERGFWEEEKNAY